MIRGRELNALKVNTFAYGRKAVEIFSGNTFKLTTLVCLLSFYSNSARSSAPDFGESHAGAMSKTV